VTDRFPHKGISNRKEAHIDICCQQTEKILMKRSNGFEDIEFVHNAFPEINFAEISLKTTFLGHTFNYPVFISSITGGMEKGLKINKLLAQVAEDFGIGLGAGSQRIALEDESKQESFTILRATAPHAFIAANLGIVQFNKGYGIKEAKRAIEMLEADALILHTNPLQEAIQPEGDFEFKGLLQKIKGLTKAVDKPIIIKEVGAGISFEVAKKLIASNVAAIEVAGAGGTSWAAIEGLRAAQRHELLKQETGAHFRNWGIPTAISTIEVLSATQGQCEIISSGGIRTGIEAAKALALGAKLVGVALPVACLAATKTEKELKAWLNQFIYELKVTMFILGAKNLEALKTAPILITGKTKDWLLTRGIDLPKQVQI